MRELTYIEAIAEATAEEMARDESVFVIGEDVDIDGGVYNATAGLVDKHGSERVFGAPISESAFCGLAAGAAMTGLRPVVELMYFDFIMVAMDQVANQIANLPFMSGGQVATPVTIRAQATGIGTNEGAQHSHSLESWFAHTPGLKVVMPATAYDAKGLLKAAIRDDSPVIFIENRTLYFNSEELPDDEWLVPIGSAEIVRSGTDITLVAMGATRHKALTAAETLSDQISVEVVDPRSIQPFDMVTVADSVRKTGRVGVIHEAPTRAGIGAEIVRRIVDECFDWLDAPPKVLGGTNLPVPFAANLERACYPDENAIIDFARRVYETY